MGWPGPDRKGLSVWLVLKAKKLSGVALRRTRMALALQVPLEPGRLHKAFYAKVWKEPDPRSGFA